MLGLRPDGSGSNGSHGAIQDTKTGAKGQLDNWTTSWLHLVACDIASIVARVELRT